MTTTDLLERGLGRKRFSELVQRAKRLGMSPSQHMKYLVDQDIAISRIARTKTISELLPRGQEVDDREFDRLVEKARTAHHLRTHRKKRN